ncbi:hypothetical protein AB6A40_002213 [Gnathostoma spinigerum]|uniref:Uncharacterized protein n=1 Tax=Gnathostoma spinigerum TaxID=75299 RepID=A0ABD6EBI2_9BILA
MSSIGSLSEYFTSLNVLLNEEDWSMAEDASKLLSIRDPHSQLRFLQVESVENERRPQIDSVFDDIACLHLTVLYHIDRKKFENAFNTHVMIIQVFNKEILQKEKDQNWFMPIFYQLCTDLRLLARAADTRPTRTHDPEQSSYYEQSATYIMECYRTCVNDV